VKVGKIWFSPEEITTKDDNYKTQMDSVSPEDPNWAILAEKAHFRQ
jgi:hypothetical protein